MRVRWGLDELPELLSARPFLVASDRWSGLIEAVATWSEIPSHRIEVPEGCDGIVAVGGGSAIDTAKAASAASGLPLVSVPTTYSGAEWTTFFGVRDPDRRMKGGGGGAHLAGIVYEPELTLALPRAETVGTALNALAHCAEALYVEGHNPEADVEALEGARLIGEWLPQVVERPGDLEARTGLLRGACHGGAALGKSFLALGHAMAQALGGRYGLPHGTMNALCLPPALRFNAEVAPEAVARFGAALAATDPAARVEELGRLGGVERLRDFGVPEDELRQMAEAVVERAGAKANPRPASAAEVEDLLRSIW
ncbi:MAG: iron-containing alcohol dehydrogenase [Actinobacteria bacterium]|nr:iron-containing alcohol dehydrogenase [Actinomycetota bacterium]